MKSRSARAGPDYPRLLAARYQLESRARARQTGRRCWR